ncbi:hypothetical protein BDZ45DRAFT_380997 [Acephala macrosclerotiorum]|nr:hypothetical protein BDZ45DRAFT_380997 [Acephala macrosclerotiorum]
MSPQSSKARSVAPFEAPRPNVSCRRCAATYLAGRIYARICSYSGRTSRSELVHQFTARRGGNQVVGGSAVILRSSSGCLPRSCFNRCCSRPLLVPRKKTRRSPSNARSLWDQQIPKHPRPGSLVCFCFCCTAPARLKAQLRVLLLQFGRPCDIIVPSQARRSFSPLVPVSGASAPSRDVEMLCARSNPSFEGIKDSRDPFC